jgi:hypothetical protein
MHHWSDRKEALMKSFFARAFHAFMKARQLKAEQFLRDHAHLLDQYKARTEAEIYKARTETEVEEISPAVFAVPAE